MPGFGRKLGKRGEEQAERCRAVALLGDTNPCTTSWSSCQSPQSLQPPKERGSPSHGSTARGSRALTLVLEVQDDGSVHGGHRQGQSAVSQLHVQAHQPQVVLPVQGPHGLGKGKGIGATHRSAGLLQSSSSSSGDWL